MGKLSDNTISCIAIQEQQETFLLDYWFTRREEFRKTLRGMAGDGRGRLALKYLRLISKKEAARYMRGLLLYADYGMTEVMLKHMIQVESEEELEVEEPPVVEKELERKNLEREIQVFEERIRYHWETIELLLEQQKFKEQKLNDFGKD